MSTKLDINRALKALGIARKDLVRREQDALREIEVALEGVAWAEVMDIARPILESVEPSATRRTRSLLWRIVQEVKGIVGAREGVVREGRTWRDDLAYAIATRFGSRYAFCQATGLDQGQLSKILKGEAGLPADRLEELLRQAGYRHVLAEDAQLVGSR